MTDVVSLLFITMIRIACKITKFSLPLYVHTYMYLHAIYCFFIDSINWDMEPSEPVVSTTLETLHVVHVYTCKGDAIRKIKNLYYVVAHSCLL